MQDALRSLGEAGPVAIMHYVYLLRSINHPDQKYSGITDDLKKRLGEHNAGKSIHTNKFKPWRLVTYIAFDVP